LWIALAETERRERESPRVAEVDVLHKRCFHEAVATSPFPCRFLVFFNLRSIAIFLRNSFLFLPNNCFGSRHLEP
jgi:hypothetical protein